MIETKILSVRNPQWATENGRAINCLVRTNTLIDEVSFTASPDDSEAHGRELFARLLAGEFGPIAPREVQSVQDGPSCCEVPSYYERLERFLLVANQENARKSARSVAVVWASMIDNLLDELLQNDASRLREKGQHPGRPPKTYHARIKRAEERGLIDANAVERCKHIKRIRNAFAHEWQCSLQTEGMLPSLTALYEADHSRVLIFHEDLDYLIQQVYSGSCARLVLDLMTKLHKATAEK